MGKQVVKTIEYKMPVMDQDVIESKDLLRKAEKLTIKTQKGADQTVEMLVDIKLRIKAVKEKQAETIKPIKDAIKPLEKFFKDILEPLERAEKMFKNAVGMWNYEQQRAAKEVEKAFAAEGKVMPAIDRDAGRRNDTDKGRVVTVTKWDFAITDINALSVDILRAVVGTKRGKEGLEEVLRGLINAGIRTIAGVNIFETTSVSVTVTGE
jgi:hypothetical protein